MQAYSASSLKMSDSASEILPEEKSDLKEKVKFECPECSKSFKTTKQLKRHTTNEHLRDDAFQCPLCPKRFREFCHLGIHIRLGHHDDSDIAVTQEFSCFECAEMFPESEGLKNHMKANTYALALRLIDLNLILQLLKF